MAGFSSIGTVTPPRVNPRPMSGYLGVNLPNYTGGRADFLNDVNVASSQLDNSPLHRANIWLKQMGLNPDWRMPTWNVNYPDMKVPNDWPMPGQPNSSQGNASQTINRPIQYRGAMTPDPYGHGQGYRGAARGTASDPYGLSPSDFLDIQRFMANPMDTNNAAGYQNLVSRIRGEQNGSINPGRGTIPGLNNDEFDRFTNDLPLLLWGGFGLGGGPADPSILQNWHIPVNNIPGLRF